MSKYKVGDKVYIGSGKVQWTIIGVYPKPNGYVFVRVVNPTGTRKTGSYTNELKFVTL